MLPQEDKRSTNGEEGSGREGPDTSMSFMNFLLTPQRRRRAQSGNLNFSENHFSLMFGVVIFFSTQSTYLGFGN